MPEMRDLMETSELAPQARKDQKMVPVPDIKLLAAG